MYICIMKRLFYFLAAALTLMGSGIVANAQVDERAPGIYAIVNGESIPLNFTSGNTAVSTTNIIGFEVGNTKITYKGATSGTIASDTFVMVIDPEKKALTKTLKVYNPFIKTMTPGNILILPLSVVKEKRLYDEGKSVMGIKTEVKGRMDFEWEQISDNSFSIKVLNLIPGEYGFVFRVSKLADFDYSAIYGFTIAE